MSFLQYQTRTISVMAERFFEDRKPWPEGVYLRTWSGQSRKLPTVDTNSHGPFPIATGDWVVRYASGKVEVFGNVPFNEEFEVKPGS